MISSLAEDRRAMLSVSKIETVSTGSAFRCAQTYAFIRLIQEIAVALYSAQLTLYDLFSARYFLINWGL